MHVCMICWPPVRAVQRDFNCMSCSAPLQASLDCGVHRHGCMYAPSACHLLACCGVARVTLILLPSAEASYCPLSFCKCYRSYLHVVYARHGILSVSYPVQCKPVVLDCIAFMSSCVCCDTLWTIACRAREWELNAAVCQQSSGSCAASQFHPQPFAAAAAARQLRCGSAAREHRGNSTSMQRCCRHAHTHQFKRFFECYMKPCIRLILFLRPIRRAMLPQLLCERAASMRYSLMM